MQKDFWIEKLQSKRRHTRLKAIKKLAKDWTFDWCDEIPETRNANVQFRTCYSGFDRMPAFVAYYAAKFSQPVFGMVDYASLAGAEELRLSCRMTGGVYFCGAEVSVRTAGGEKIRAMAFGVPRKLRKKFHAALAPYRAAHREYVLDLAGKINARLKKYGVHIEAKDAFLSLKKQKVYAERLLYGKFAEAVIEKYATGEKILAFLDEAGVELTEEMRLTLADRANSLYENDLAYALFCGLKIRRPEEKAFSLKEFASLCGKFGAICSAEASGADPAVLDELAAEGATSATIAMSDDEKTLSDFYDACFARDLIPLARTVIDHSRKKIDSYFGNEELARKYRETTLAIVGHEISASIRGEDGIFGEEGGEGASSLADRVRLYSRIGSKGGMYKLEKRK